VRYFTDYHIDYLNPELQHAPPPTSIDELVKDFIPEYDPIDKKILEEIIGNEFD